MTATSTTNGAYYDFGAANTNTYLSLSTTTSYDSTTQYTATTVSKNELGNGYVEFTAGSLRTFKSMFVSMETTSGSEKAQVLRAPKWESILPTLSSYEVCVFQKDDTATDWYYQKCWYYNYNPTTEANDGDFRCTTADQGNCFSIRTGAN